MIFLRFSTKAILFLSVLALSACHNETVKPTAMTVISVNANEQSEIKLSELADDVSMIRLSTDVVMDKIQRIHYNDGKIYISDGSTLFTFSESGELLASFQKKGKGPGEYLYCGDFFTKGDTIIIHNNLHLLKYEQSGNFLGAQKLDIEGGAACAPFGDNELLFYHGQGYDPDKHFKLTATRNGHVVNRYLPTDSVRGKYLYVFQKQFFSYCNDSLFFFEPFNDTIYVATSAGVTPRFYVDFQGENIPQSFFNTPYKDIMAFFNALNSTNYARLAACFATTKHLVFFDIYSLSQKAKLLVVFDRKTQSVKVSPHITDDVFFSGLKISDENFEFFPDNQIFVPVFADQIVEWREKYPPSEKFKDLINAVKEEDNPVLIVLKDKRK